MPKEVYHRLREQLDQYSFGFPATESGIELKILERLFTEEEAEMFLLLTLELETPEDLAARTGRGPEAAASLLDRMAEKGLIFRLRKGEAVKYGATPFVAGIMEFQLPTLDRELAEMLDQYHEHGFHAAITEGAASFLRPIPVNRSLDVSNHVTTHDDARDIIRQAKLVAVADCICRVQHGLLDQGCGKPLEVCFLFGSNARYYIDRGMARQVSVEEGLDIQSRAEEAGLVTQPGTSQNPGGMCNCCGDCCGVLRALNRHPRPAEKVFSNYFAAVDQDLCTACETCLDRCQMGALSINDDDAAEVNLDRCIGCGLCVTTCPEEALRLEPKPEDQRRTPPLNSREQALMVARMRGLVP